MVSPPQLSELFTSLAYYTMVQRLRCVSYIRDHITVGSFERPKRTERTTASDRYQFRPVSVHRSWSFGTIHGSELSAICAFYLLVVQIIKRAL